MIILASDTSTKSISVALNRDLENIYCETFNTGTTHAQTHIPLIIKMLKGKNLEFNDVDYFACSIGPGSYTGIRIGVVSTKAMAYSANKGAVGVSTLEALAYPHSDKASIVCPLMDARNRRVFSASFKGNEIIIKQENYLISEYIGKLCEYISKENKGNMNILFCGDAGQKYEEDSEIIGLLNELKGKGQIINYTFITTDPQACDIAEIAYKRIIASDNLKTLADPFLLKPNYISASNAERMKKKELKQ